MASLSGDGKGFRIWFIDTHGARRSIRLGAISRRDAQRVLIYIERLIEARQLGLTPDAETQKWLASVGAELQEKLAAVGLIDEVACMTLRRAIDGFLQRHAHHKPWTQINIRRAMDYLLRFFGETRRIDHITIGDVEDYRRWLLTEASIQHGGGLAEATASKHLSWAAAVFRDAIKHGLRIANPFDAVKKGTQINRERRCYVPASDIECLIEIAPTLEWKLLLALARYAGVRVPSEPFSMTWDCIDWHRSLMRVVSPKTARSKPYRMVPIFPPIRPHLNALWEATPPGRVYIFHELRQRGSTAKSDAGFWKSINLRTQLQRLVARAGLKPWPKLWQNLRASAEMDLLARFPAPAVCEWVGHTPAVAESHYYTVRPEDIQRALEQSWSDINEGSGHETKRTV